jgi:hypothetical protein
MRQRRFIAAISLLFALSLTLSALAQSDAVDQAFTSVPEPIRAQLIERFRSMVKYESTERWDEFYDLLIKPRVESKEEFVDQRRKSAASQKEKWLIEFVPERVDREQPDWVKADYRIVGYAKVKERNCVVKRQGFVYAFLRDGEWYFSGYVIELTPSHSPPPPCLSEEGASTPIDAAPNN